MKFNQLEKKYRLLAKYNLEYKLTDLNGGI